MPARIEVRVAGALLLVALLAPGGARGDVPCADETRRMCQGIEPGDGRIVSCLRARWGDLSQACRDRLDQAASKAEVQLLVCEPDLFRFCSTVPAKRDATLACLAANMASLTADCRDVVQRERSRAAALQSACRSEAPTYCADVPAGDVGKLTACLAARSKELSPACQAALSP
jgi:Golgi apparatus protein 1